MILRVGGNGCRNQIMNHFNFELQICGIHGHITLPGVVMTQHMYTTGADYMHGGESMPAFGEEKTYLY